MKRGKRSLGVIALVVGVFAAILLYLSWPAATGKPGGADSLTVGNAILILAYLFYPLLAFLAAALLVIAVMLFAATVVERRRARGPI